MKHNSFIRILTVCLFSTLIFTSCIPALFGNTQTSAEYIVVIRQTITKEYDFSDPEIVIDGEYVYVYIDESDLNRINPGKPVLPVNLTVMEFPFNAEIINVRCYHSIPETIGLTQPLAFALSTVPDDMNDYESQKNMDLSVYEGTDPYPNDWIS